MSRTFTETCTCVNGEPNSATCPSHGERAAEIERRIRKGKRVLVPVTGADDVFWTKVTKPEARWLMVQGGMQLTCWIDDDGDCRIDRRSTGEGVNEL